MPDEPSEEQAHVRQAQDLADDPRAEGGAYEGRYELCRPVRVRRAPRQRRAAQSPSLGEGASSGGALGLQGGVWVIIGDEVDEEG